MTPILRGLLIMALTLCGSLVGCTTNDAPKEQPTTIRPPSPFDFSRVPRRIRHLPDLVSEQPRYQMLLFEGGIPAWMILDQSQAASQPSHYDLLYVDLDADGDLTDPDERLVANFVLHEPSDGDQEESYLAVWELSRFVHPGTKAVQTEVEFSWTQDARGGCLSFYFDCQANRGFSPSEIAEMLDTTPEAIGDPARWISQRGFSGPAGMGVAPIAPPSPEPSAAPIYVIGDHRDWPVFMAAARRRTWDHLLAKDIDNDITVRFLVQGDSAAATTAIDLDYLPQGEPVLATLRYLGTDGQPKTATYQLRDRC